MRLTMYLLREGTTLHDDLFRETANVREVSSKNLTSGASAIYLMTGRSKSPDWVRHVSDIADLGDDVLNFESQSLGAVLLLLRNERVFAITFGIGFHGIRPSLIERGFGLRVTANVVSEDKVRSAQTRGVARDARDQKTILPVDGQFADLDIEVNEDWLRQLAGTATDKSFGTSISGSDSLRITVPEFSIRDVESKVDAILAAYQTDRYKSVFPFLDQISPIDKSDQIVEQLDDLVTEQLRDHEPRITFAAPDPFELDRLDHFEFTASYNRFDVEDLENDAIYKVVDEVKRDRSPLDSVRVYAVDSDGGLVDRVRDLKAYVQTEVELDGTNYLLSAGLWFIVREDFAASVDAQVDAIPDLSAKLDLPNWNAAVLKADTSDPTAEGSYNILAAASKGFALMDKKLVYFGAGEKLEICDLLTPDGELLCVKSASNSAVLSHLVAQAVVSASSWGDSKFQTHLQSFWSSLTSGTAPLGREEATFVLTIATPKPGPLSKSLFFFTKVQIANSVELITRGSFKVALARIEMTGVVATKRKRAPRTTTTVAFA
jgi:uncharacterized protein (TIGR04141 family)